MCRCVECLGIVGVYMSGMHRDCGYVDAWVVGMYMCGVYRDCGCVHVWSVYGLWVCTCVECLGIVSAYMCGV